MYPIIDKEKTGLRIQNFMKMKNITAKAIQESLGLTCVQAVYHWINGRCLPSLENLYALSDLFEVPMDMLVAGDRKEQLVQLKFAGNNRLFAYFMKLNEFAA